METKLNKSRMERVRRKCGFICGVEVEAEGSRGGLCLAWKEDIKVTLRSFSKWHIDVIIKEDDIEGEWRFTGIYGSPYLKDKNIVWNLLKRLAREDRYPWLVEGDFNEILYSFEKSGGVQRDMKLMEAFREVLDDCQLLDIGYSSVWFTWERGIVQHLPYSYSDHCPLLLNTKKSVAFTGNKRFHFEAWWTMEDSFEEVLKESWESTNGTLMEKLERLQFCLKEWARVKEKEKVGLKKELTNKLEFF
ncbi:reverse transcriptase [Gossypium australe]|uniref:Reverse transcriptase n=1 Tax=Gossypium australe TaxID=47621 RepID=A0A5B6VIP7_9ROSI|nr:reverse transcriptase [Gossypium australe]